MQNKYLKTLVVVLAMAFVMPQIAMAAWWNPFSWGIWNRVFHFQRTEQKQEQQQNQENNIEMFSDLYPMYPDLKWGTPVASTVKVLDFNIKGYEISATDKVNGNSDANKFVDYYDTKLKATGWVDENNLAADGIQGSQRGYKKGNDYIVISYYITPGKITSGENEPLQWECPCGIVYKVMSGSVIKK